MCKKSKTCVRKPIALAEYNLRPAAYELDHTFLIILYQKLTIMFQPSTGRDLASSEDCVEQLHRSYIGQERRMSEMF